MINLFFDIFVLLSPLKFCIFNWSSLLGQKNKILNRNKEKKVIFPQIVLILNFEFELTLSSEEIAVWYVSNIVFGKHIVLSRLSYWFQLVIQFHHLAIISFVFKIIFFDKMYHKIKLKISVSLLLSSIVATSNYYYDYPCHPRQFFTWLTTISSRVK